VRKRELESERNRSQERSEQLATMSGARRPAEVQGLRVVHGARLPTETGREPREEHGEQTKHQGQKAQMREHDKKKDRARDRRAVPVAQRHVKKQEPGGKNQPRRDHEPCLWAVFMRSCVIGPYSVGNVARTYRRLKTSTSPRSMPKPSSLNGGTITSRSNRA
jgi:hypothetical protein